eukprot:35879-Eustigmatos_ZCMA.PRE.1
MLHNLDCLLTAILHNLAGWQGHQAAAVVDGHSCQRFWPRLEDARDPHRQYEHGRPRHTG